MHLTIDREQFSTQLTHVSRIVTTRTSLPILTNVLLETDINTLRISATDLELAISTALPATVLQEGSYTVPARLLQEVVAQTTEETITLQVVGGEIKVTAESFTASLPGIDAAEYPALPEIVEISSFTLPAQVISTALRKVVVASAQDQGRPILTGVLCHIENGKGVFAATDSFRLSEYVFEIPQDTINARFILPSRAVQELVRMVSQTTPTDIAVSIGEGQVVLKIQEIEITSRLLSGTFPSYQAIIPSSFVRSITVSVELLTQALRLINAFSNQGISTTRFEISADVLEPLTVVSHKSQKGSGVQRVPITQSEGEGNLVLAVNTKFLLDALGGVNSSQVTLHCSGVTSPLVIKGEDKAHLQLVMPIRLDS